MGGVERSRKVGKSVFGQARTRMCKPSCEKQVDVSHIKYQLRCSSRATRGHCSQENITPSSNRPKHECALE